MNLRRLVPVLIALLSVILTLATTSAQTQAAPNGGVVGDGTLASCTNAALTTAMNGGGTVTFNCGGPATITMTAKTITATTTINGGGNITLTVVDSGSGVEQLFTVNNGVGLTLTNLTITDVTGASYAFPIVNSGRVVLSGVNVFNTNFLINNNNASSTASIAASTFVSNTGSIVSSISPITVTQSQFVRNTPGSSGLIVMYSNALARIDDCDFISNTTTNSSLLHGNGGIFSVTQSLFQQNTGSNALVAAYNTTNIDTSDFISNTTVAIYVGAVNQALQISNSHFYWNRNGGAASVIYLNGQSGTVPVLTLTNSSLMSNTAAGGAIYNYGGKVTISNTAFVSNTSNNSSGALYLDYPNVVQVLSSTFQLGMGGGIYVNGSANPLIISDSLFISNTSQFSAGAIDAGTLTVTHSSFISNTSYSGGSGAIDASRQAYITGSTFLTNTGYWAGAMELSSGGFGPYFDVVANSVIKGNTSTSQGGGGIRATQHLTLIDSEVSNNTVLGNSYGGGIYFANGYILTVTNSVIQNNIVTGTSGYGGGVYLWGQGGYITNSAIISNSAARGGGLYQTGSGSLLMANTNLLNNTASNGGGGGLYQAGSGSLLMANTNILSNTASSGGGGVYQDGGPVHITGSTLQGNTANSGGGFYQWFSPAYITSTLVQSNTVTTFFGGGLEAHDALTLHDVNVTGNRNLGTGGQGYGGGLYFNSFASPLRVNRSLFYNNVASHSASQGGGLYVTSPAFVTNTTFYSNSAGNGGGGLYVTFGSFYAVTLTNLSIMSNTLAGGVITGQLANNGPAYSVKLVNTLIGGGSGGNCIGNKVLSLGYNLSSDASCTITTTGDLSSTNPLLNAFANNGGPTFSFMPQRGSLAINNGDNSRCPIDDQRGVGRPISSACDIGSIESPYLIQQAITFNSIASHFVDDAPFIITATASSSLPVAFNYSGACSVSGNTVTLSGVAGSCTITATQSGNATYDPAPNVARTFSVTLRSQTITFSGPANRPISASPVIITATASSGLSVMVTSQTPSICSVGGNLVTLLTNGLCALRASQGGNSVYAPAPNLDRSFTIYLTQTITFNAIPNQVVGDSVPLSATASSGLAVWFESLTTNVCDVSGDAAALFGAGSCVIIAHQDGNATYWPADDAGQAFTVFMPQTITFDILPDQLISAPPFSITATASSNLPVTFAASGVCGVNGSTVTLSGVVGSCTITATQSGDATYAPAPAVARTFNVTALLPQAITFAAIPDHFISDAPFSIAPTASSGLSVTVTSLTINVCTIDNNLVTLIATGQCTLHATQAGNQTYAPAPDVDRSFTVKWHTLFLPLVVR